MKRRLTITLFAAIVLGLAVVPPIASAGTAAAQGLDPATKRYVAVLTRNLTPLANASEAAHAPCYHSGNGPATTKCQRLYAALGATTKKTLGALSKVSAPRELLKEDKELKAALAAYLARINSDLKVLADRAYKKFRGTHDTPVTDRLVDAIRAITFVFPEVYLPTPI